MIEQINEYFKTAFSVTISLFIFEEGKQKVLIINNPEEPFKNAQKLPGKLVKPDESFEKACKDILQETIQNQNLYLEQLNEFCKLGFPVMIGPSRKSFIGTTLNLPVDDRLEGTAASVAVGVMNGARIVRVHDVKEIKRVVTIVEKIRTAA